MKLSEVEGTRGGGAGTDKGHELAKLCSLAERLGNVRNWRNLGSHRHEPLRYV